MNYMQMFPNSFIVFDSIATSWDREWVIVQTWPLYSQVISKYILFVMYRNIHKQVSNLAKSFKYPPPPPPPPVIPSRRRWRRRLRRKATPAVPSVGLSCQEDAKRPVDARMFVYARRRADAKVSVDAARSINATSPVDVKRPVDSLRPFKVKLKWLKIVIYCIFLKKHILYKLLRL